MLVQVVEVLEAQPDPVVVGLVEGAPHSQKEVPDVVEDLAAGVPRSLMVVPDVVEDQGLVAHHIQMEAQVHVVHHNFLMEALAAEGGRGVHRNFLVEVPAAVEEDQVVHHNFLMVVPGVVVEDLGVRHSQKEGPGFVVEDLVVGVCHSQKEGPNGADYAAEVHHSQMEGPEVVVRPYPYLTKDQVVGVHHSQMEALDEVGQVAVVRPYPYLPEDQVVLVVPHKPKVAVVRQGVLVVHHTQLEVARLGQAYLQGLLVLVGQGYSLKRRAPKCKKTGLSGLAMCLACVHKMQGTTKCANATQVGWRWTYRNS